MNGRNGPFALQKVSTLSLVPILHSTLYLLFRSPGATTSHPPGDALSTELLLKAFARTIDAAQVRTDAGKVGRTEMRTDR
jgi:hypothetical protein